MTTNDREYHAEFLFDYTSGVLDYEQCEEVEASAAADAELAAKIKFMRLLNPTVLDAPRELVLRESSAPSAGGSPARCRYLAMSPRRIVAAAVALMLFVTAGGVTLALLNNPPLMQDDFDDNWVESTLWINPRPRVKENDGVLWLHNRGCLVTAREFTGPVSVSFRWRWIDLAEFPMYAEILTVAFHTTGEMMQRHPFEARDALSVKIDSHDGNAYLVRHPEPRLGTVANGTLKLPAGEWHDVRITDDGNVIALYIRGPAIGDQYWSRPVFRIPYETALEGRQIAIYNRELVAGVPHLSQIDDFEVRLLQQN